MNWGVLALAILIVLGALYASTSLFSTHDEIVNATAESRPLVPASSADAVITAPPSAPSPSVEEVVLDVEASRFTYTPNTLRVKSGQNITIRVTNIDQTHGIRIRDLGLSGTKSITFIAPAPGRYAFSCPTMCGDGHGDMQGTLIVE
jgi:cytochrome c oxidase subunit 2